MSIYTIERVLFDLTCDPGAAARLRETGAAFLSTYPLEGDEATLIQTLDAGEMLARGIDPMLTMRAFNAVEGRARMPEYMRRINVSAGK